jgi:hypothetical protein
LGVIFQQRTELRRFSVRVRLFIMILLLSLVQLSTSSWSFSTAVLGGPGGGLFSIVSPPGEVRGKSGAWIDAVSITCGNVDPSYPRSARGEFRFKPGYGAGFASLSDRAVGGSGGGDWRGADCNFVDHVVDAVRVELAHNDARTFINDIRVECARIMPLYPRERSGGIRQPPGPPDTGYQDGGVLPCPAGHWAVGVHGTAGICIDSIGLICQPTVALRLCRAFICSPQRHGWV